MSEVTIKIDSAALINRLHTAERQVPFALALGTNRTIEEAQAAIQQHLQETYTIRRSWVLQGIKIDNADRATKDKPRAVVHLDPARGFMSKFELGDTKLPLGRSIAIPVDAKRNKADIVAKSQRPRAFHFTRGYSSVRTRSEIWQGDKRTFMIRRADGSGVILQRLGASTRRRRERENAARKAQGLDNVHHNTDVRLLFLLRPKAETPANLEFFEVGEQVIRDRYVINVQGMLAYAIKTAK